MPKARETKKERERERDIYIYIYIIDREREMQTHKKIEGHKYVISGERGESTECDLSIEDEKKKLLAQSWSDSGVDTARRCFGAKLKKV